MTPKLISPDDSQYFTVTSIGDYDRHHYKIVSKTGKSVIVEDWEIAQMTWFQQGKFLSHIEVLDENQESKGFK